MITIVKNMNFKEYINVNAESIINFMKLKNQNTRKRLNILLTQSPKRKQKEKRLKKLQAQKPSLLKKRVKSRVKK